jgi:small-conductance mechanosensitive channel
MEILQTQIFGNTALEWSIALGTALAAYFALVFAKRLVIRYLSRLAKRTETYWDDVITSVVRRTRPFFLAVIAVVIGSRLLDLPDGARDLIRFAAIFATLLQAGFWGRALIVGLIDRHVARARDNDPAAATTMSALGVLLQLVLWAVLVLMAMQNLGVEIGPLLAGLGVGGIAVALAVQNILGDLFASLSIVLDKPFVIGDFIIVGEMPGTVEHIGLKTTRLRSLSGEQLVFSNSDLLSARIRNFKRMYERRILFRLGVVYQTPREQVEAIPKILREAVERQDKVRFDRAHFVSFGASSLDYEVVYFVLVPEFGTYMDIQQGINLHIMERFEAEGIEFAYPTQTLFIEQMEPEAVGTGTGRSRAPLPGGAV